ncbi:unnamed protein product [Rotaria socialis]|uniref:Uncharacterized protein n=1 Tax=Rotaria socialis TaxID=392032 RepID=A0A820TMA1_9BILA|nr:unnamed protein product [Rotaria socialis]CAF4467872.1 unnamed protein product [Rotaria socialis]CAF4855501.1 unnamed protein product [Rotaria socialis]
MGAARSTRRQNNFTLVSKRLIQQFQSTHQWSTGPPTPQSINTALTSTLRLGVDIAGEPFVRKNIPLGELLNFSTLTCPNSAKSWFGLVD